MSDAVNRLALRAGLVAQSLAILGPQREQNAEWLADNLLRHIENLVQAGSSVLAIGPGITEPVA